MLPFPPNNLSPLAPYPYENAMRGQQQSPPLRPLQSSTNQAITLPLPPDHYGPPALVPLSNPNFQPNRSDRNEQPTQNGPYRQPQLPPLVQQINRSPPHQPRDISSLAPSFSYNLPSAAVDNISGASQEGSSVPPSRPSFSRPSMQANTYLSENNQSIDPSIPINNYRPRPTPIDSFPINSQPAQEIPSQSNSELNKRHDSVDQWPMSNLASNQSVQARSLRKK